MRLAFAWDPVKAAANQFKHGTQFDDVLTVFDDPLAVSIKDPDSYEEERWVTTGADRGGRAVVVVHTFQETDGLETAIRIISARRPTRREIKSYSGGDAP